jgi:hypothetical protein
MPCNPYLIFLLIMYCDSEGNLGCSGGFVEIVKKVECKKATSLVG